MDKVIAEALDYSTRETLEMMCFAEALSTENEPVDEVALTVRVEMHGDFEGDFRLSVDREAARELAIEFLGCEEDESVDEADITRAIGELANIVCGSTMARCKPESSFSLSTPERVTESGSGESGIRRVFDIDGRHLCCTIALSSGSLTE